MQIDTCGWIDFDTQLVYSIMFISPMKTTDRLRTIRKVFRQGRKVSTVLRHRQRMWLRYVKLLTVSDTLDVGYRCSRSRYVYRFISRQLHNVQNR